MELYGFSRSMAEQDRSAIVVCDTAHKIVYMNPAACDSYKKYGGASLLGTSLLSCHNESSRAKILSMLAWFGESRDNNIVHTYYNKKENKDVYMVALREQDGTLIGYYEKHEYRTRDNMPFYDLR